MVAGIVTTICFWRLKLQLKPYIKHLCSSPTSETNVGENPLGQDWNTSEECTAKDRISKNMMCVCRSSQQLQYGVRSEKPHDTLKRVPGNDKCADCGSPEPDWASLNLGVLICIECSGVHRNLGCHISKPNCDEPISTKAKFIHAKYAERRFIQKVKDPQHLILLEQLWENVRSND